MDIQNTGRGFAIASFQDFYGVSCSIQDSSLAEYDAIWLGGNDNRMHLTREQVAQLLPLLRAFVEHGSIATPPSSEQGEG